MIGSRPTRGAPAILTGMTIDVPNARQPIPASDYLDYRASRVVHPLGGERG
jgi:hypothetical protein